MNILFPVVRFSDVSEKVAPFVEYYSRLCDSKVFVLRVEPAIDQYIEMRLKEAGEWLEEFITQNLANCTIARSDFVAGDPAAEIIKYVDNHQIDMVIIGTHGRQGLKDILFGSVAKDVISKSSAPVLTVNPHRLSDSYMSRNEACFQSFSTCQNKKP
ncbi:MAG: universal stress protein [Desulfobacterales bacterium]|jgi:nucleotide-binding universal stress UspA family protein|nr:universal stress protein [Desulfobacterales bacterium]